MSDYERKALEMVNIIKDVIPLTLRVRDNLKKGQYIEKCDHTFVTIGDFAVQAILFNRIRKTFPGDHVFAEEDLSTLSKDERFKNNVISLLPSDIDIFKEFSFKAKTIENTQPTWVIDPIDGTSSFVKGRSFAIGTAMLVNKRAVLSVSAWPGHTTEESGTPFEGPIIYVAINDLNGKKAFALDMNNNRYDIPLDKQPESNMLSYRNDRSYYLVKKLQLKETITLPGMLKGFCLGTGVGCIYVRDHYFTESVWDIAPYEVFVKCCGGSVTMGDGSEIQYLPNGEVDNSDLGIVATMGGKGFHSRALEAFNEYRNFE